MNTEFTDSKDYEKIPLAERKNENHGGSEVTEEHREKSYTLLSIILLIFPDNRNSENPNLLNSKRIPAKNKTPCSSV